MRHTSTAATAAIVLFTATLSGCYHAVIETGRAPSPVKIEKAWAHGFLFGLVPPEVTETAQKCVSGVSKVETQQSFLNMVASGLTYGVYSPMSVKVTCAQAAGPA